jgi:hypothetical protein
MKVRLRSVAVAVSLLFLGGTLEAHLHRAFARHGFCSEHGEPIHLSEAPALQMASESAAVHRAQAPAHGAHDCAALRFLTQGVELTASTPNAQAQAPTAELASRPGSARRAIPLLQVAPKGSPPV